MSVLLPLCLGRVCSGIVSVVLICVLNSVWLVMSGVSKYTRISFKSVSLSYFSLHLQFASHFDAGHS